jgi:hypothetical protein
MSLKKEISKPMNCDKLHLRRESSSMSLGLGCDCGFGNRRADEDEISVVMVRMYDVRYWQPSKKQEIGTGKGDLHT